jgi:signal peptidase I
MTATDRRVYMSAFLSLLAPGLGHAYGDRWLEGLAFAGGTVAIGMLGTVAVLASPFLARAALVGATTAWIALWCVAFVSAVRGARSADPEGGVAAVAAVALAPMRRGYFKGLLVVLTLASLATWAIAVRERVMEVFHVPSPSMEPAIVPGTRVLVDKLAYRSGPVRRGDVVVFVNPNERWQTYVKRVVALPGDTVELRGDDVIVNGAPLAHDLSEQDADGARILRETNAGATYSIRVAPWHEDGAPAALAAVRVPIGSCFLLGDNRRRSKDSRDLGPIPLTDVVGKVARTW